MRSYRIRRACSAMLLGSLACIAAVATGPVTSVSGERGTAETAARSGDFQFLLAVSTNRPLVDSLGYDPLARLDLRNTPYTRDVINISGWKIGRYRRQGAHLIALQNKDLSQHLQVLQEHVDELVPVGFTGVVIIDYEPFWALWDRTPNNPSDEPEDAFDSDYKDDWRDYIRAERPYLLDRLSDEQAEAVFKRTYEAFMRTFLLSTYYRCKQLRPRAQWGFYNYPQVLFYSDLTPFGVKGYGDLSHAPSRMNDEIAWYFEAVDVISPRIYPSRRVRESYPPGRRPPGEITTEVHEEWLASMIRESVRLADGKPVLPYHSPIFYSREDFGREAVEQFQHEEVFRILAENGASGVIIWHALATRGELDQWNRLWPDELRPAGINASREIDGR